LLRADPAGKIELVIVDTGGIPDLYAYDFLRGKIHGYGECVWKKKKVVIDTLFRVGEIADYKERIIGLLA
jgi:hypothetical protein